MNITISYNHDNDSIAADFQTPDELYQFVGKLELEEIDRYDLPDYITAQDDLGHNARYKVIKRGTYTKNGEKVPSLYTTCERNDFLNLNWPMQSHYEDTYLACVNSESNNYKFYEMTDDGSQIIAHYGRINADSGERSGKRSTSFSRDMFWIRYYEKLSKGYEDFSEVFEQSEDYVPESATVSTERDDNPDALALFDKLYQFAKGHIAEHTHLTEKPTVAQVKKAGDLLEHLTQATGVKAFNRTLKQLMVLIPRKIEVGSGDSVDNYMAERTANFSDIISRERDLYRAMKGVQQNTSSDTFQQHNVMVFPANEKQKQEVLNHLEDSERRQVKNIYRVIPCDQRRRFNEYCKTHQIDEVRELWHGSTNENWLSIIENSVSLDHACYGMFGRGLYFAPSSNKSQGYTSNRGSYWANGNDSTYYMGLFATAFGKPLMVVGSGNYDENDMKSHHTDCVYAKRENTSLRRDEVVFYNNDAVLLNYVVEFEN